MARSVLQRHLGITAEPTAVQVGLHKKCIPQYTVGHDARMRLAHFELLQEFEGNLSVAGNSYAGVGVGDCVRSARDVVGQMDAWVREDGQLMTLANVTGLGWFMDEKLLANYDN